MSSLFFCKSNEFKLFVNKNLRVYRINPITVKKFFRYSIIGTNSFNDGLGIILTSYDEIQVQILKKSKFDESRFIFS